MRRGLVLAFLYLSVSPLAGALTGAWMEKGYVSFGDVKRALALLIREVEELKREVRRLKRGETGYRIMRVKKNGTRVRLSEWGKVIGTVPKGTKVVVFGESGEFYLTNLGYIHKSLVE